MVILISVLILSLNIPVVQNFVKDQLVVYLEHKIKTKVRLEKVYIGFPNYLILEKLHLEGQHVDTLLALDKAEIRLKMLKLINSKAEISSIDLEGLRANIVRDSGGNFNFNYILEAFATKEEKEPQKESSFSITLGTIDIRDIGINYEDQQAKNELQLYFNALNTEVKTIDLLNNVYTLKEIYLDGLRLNLKQDQIEVVKTVAQTESISDSSSNSKPLDVAVDAIVLTNFDLDYADDHSKTYATVLFKELKAKLNDIDLAQNAFDVDSISLSDADIQAKLFIPNSPKATEATSPSPASSSTQDAMRILLASLHLKNIKLAYHNQAIAPSPKGTDFNHLNFSKLHLDLRDFKMEENNLQGEIHSAEIKEKRGLNIQKLKTDFAFNETEASLKNLFLQTPNSLLKDQIVLNYNSKDQLSTNLGDIQLNALLKNNKIGFADLLNLAPDLEKMTIFQNYPNAVLKMNLQTNGSLNNLIIPRLEVSGLGELQLLASGKIQNALTPEDLYFDFDIEEISSSLQTITQSLPENTIPTTVTLPQEFRIKGQVKGSTQKLESNLTVQTTDGDASLAAELDLSNKNQELYEIQLDLQNFYLGKIIQNPEIGKISLQLHLNGEGFEPKKMNTRLNSTINSAAYHGYAYQNIKLDASIKEGKYEFELNSSDPNLNMHLNADGLYQDALPTVALNAEIEKIDFERLNFNASPLSIAGKIDGNFKSLNPDSLDGYLDLNSFSFQDSLGQHQVDSIQLNTIAAEKLRKISLQSSILDLELDGEYHLTEIFGHLAQKLNQYYHFQAEDSTQSPSSPQFFTLNAQFKNDSLIQAYLPDLKNFAPVQAEAKYDTEADRFSFDLKLPELTYGENLLDSAVLSLDTDSLNLNYALEINSLKLPSYHSSPIGIDGRISNDVVFYHLWMQDSIDQMQFLIAGKLKSIDSIELSLNPNGLKINYEDWAVADDNRLLVNNKGVTAHNFRLSKEESEILIQSEGDSMDALLNIALTNFSLEDISKIIDPDSLMFRGRLYGSAQISELTERPKFVSELKASEVFFYEHPIGAVRLKANNANEDKIHAELNLWELGNDVNISGDYHLNNASLDFKLLMDSLQLKYLEAFSQEAIAKTEGYFSGALSFSGKATQPKISGHLKCNDIGLEIATTGSEFRALNDSIKFNSKGIAFDAFKLKDKEGNPLLIDGAILTQNYQDFDFNLDLNTENFKLIETEKSNDALIYGLLAVDAALAIRGNLDLPKVDGKLSISEETDFVFVIPQTNPSLEERAGVVEFIDQDQPITKDEISIDSLNNQSEIKGIDLSVNIEVDREAKMAILIDQASGDILNIQGQAELTAAMDPSGKTSLSGIFEVEKGSYEMSLSLLKRKFELQKGSTISWGGDPFDAKLDMQAIYKTETAPIDLLEQQISDATTLNQFKQKMPFNTLLNIGGDLMQPEISFDIRMDEEQNNVAASVSDLVEAKLNQLRTEESELNKQVFALLLLNRFVGENPYKSEAGVSTETMAKQSVSKILSKQLNNLAANLIKGVDIELDLEASEDYSSGSLNSRTDLSVDISKSLLNDRLEVSVGSNFGLEGEARENENMTNIAGDITVEYKLSKDGRYRLRSFRKNEYQVALQGQIVETGVGFIITLDYDKFSEIFKKKKK
jgi:hypothetical protein